MKRPLWCVGEIDSWTYSHDSLVHFGNCYVWMLFHLRMLDYNTGIPQLASKYGNLPPGTRFGFNDVVCAGTEESLLDCPHTQVLTFKWYKLVFFPPQRQNCRPNEAAGVICYSESSTESPKLPGIHLFPIVDGEIWKSGKNPIGDGGWGTGVKEQCYLWWCWCCCLFLGCIKEDAIDYFGHDIPGGKKKTANSQECADFSSSIPGGLFWTWRSDTETCFVKSSNSGRKTDGHAVSGNRKCGVTGRKTWYF